MDQYRSNIDMIETLFKEGIKVNEAIEIKFDIITIIALRTEIGYEIAVFDKEGEMVEQQTYRTK
jgi:predicted fused transcriptional regulator/phosphomethylpyrimidine kinase